eukprot:10343508-Ditylum_brightwellii.AAC.1
MASAVVLAAVAIMFLALTKHLSTAVADCCDQMEAAKKICQKDGQGHDQRRKTGEDGMPTIEGGYF